MIHSVQLNILKEFSNGLIHIHSQYNTLELKDKEFQLRMLDILAGALDLREKFQKRFTAYQLLKRELAEKEAKLQESSSQSDFNNFQLTELQALKLSEVDYDGLQAELNTYENADELLSTLGSLTELLNSDGGVLDQLNQVSNILQKNSGLGAVIEGLNDRLNSVLIELKDIADEAENQGDAVSVDPQQLMELTSKLDAYNKVAHKHRANVQQELIDLEEELSLSSTNLDELESAIEGLKSKIQSEETELLKLGEELHAKRVKAIPGIEKTITSALKDLKLENTVLEFRLDESDQFTYAGTSELEIYFSPNVGVAPVPIHQAASGGELSRVMLALQSLMSQRIQLKTILFDEIDTGVSGDVAQKIGATLKEMGKGMQVIAITHLPQVAAKGEQHMSVSKKIVDGRTMSSVIELDMNARIEETARLMSGDEINEAALENAKALMS